MLDKASFYSFFDKMIFNSVMIPNLSKFIFEDLQETTVDNKFNFGPVYHGGTWDGIKSIKVNGRGALGVGAYFTPDKSVAADYAAESGGKVVETFLSIKNPLKIYSIKGDGKHPVSEAFISLGMEANKAYSLVEKIEEKYGYVGTQLKTLAVSKGFDSIFQYFNGNLREIVVWNKEQVKLVEK